MTITELTQALAKVQAAVGDVSVSLRDEASGAGSVVKGLVFKLDPHGNAASSTLEVEHGPEDPTPEPPPAQVEPPPAA